MPFIQKTLIYITGRLSVWKTGKCSETNVFIVQEYRPEFKPHFRCKNHRENDPGISLAESVGFNFRGGPLLQNEGEDVRKIVDVNLLLPQTGMRIYMNSQAHTQISA